MKPKGPLLFAVAASLYLLGALLSPQEAAAAVATVNNWPATPQALLNGVSTGAKVASASGTVTVGAGTNRAMMVVVACEYSAAPSTQKLSVSYGTKSISPVATNISQRSTIWLGYLNETDLAAEGTGKTLLVKNSNATNLIAMYASAAVFSGVDQSSSPISGYSTQATASAISMTPPAYNVTAQAANAGLSLVVANWNGGTLTPPTGYTASPATYAGSNFSLGFYNKSITVTGNETPVPVTSAANSGAMVSFGLVPSGLKYTITTCADCHYYYPVDAPTTRGTPTGQFKGSHNKHAGSADGQYGYDCTRCHYNATTTSHSQGYKNISGSSVARNSYGGTTSIPVTNNEASFATCTKSTCHSTGRSNIQYATTVTWGTNGTTTCLSCHAGRAAGNGNPANSSAGFKLSTTHSQHLKLPYTAANINCNMCHSRTATDAQTLKAYSGVMYHANGRADVIFGDINYGSYTSYKSSGADAGKCANVACHGGTTRNGWTNTGAANNNHTCTHCHGLPTGVGATVPNAEPNRRVFAPGWGGTGTSTDGRTSNTDIRVGNHFVHLSSVYMKRLKCNECHTVPSNPFDGTHMTGPRYSSQSLTFGQSTTARILVGVASGSTPAQYTAFAGYTNGTATKAATCSSVYCHGNRLKNNVTSGTARKPSWGQDLTATPATATSCGRCHGFPPLDGGLHTAGNTVCSSCHNHVSTGTNPTTFVNKALHINGRVEASGGHVFPYPGSTHSVATGATNPSANCSCHDYTTAGTYPVTAGTAPKCLSCHTAGLYRAGSGTTSCYDCHGSGATEALAKPNGGTTFPNWSGSHTTHVTGQGMACSDCHANGGTGNTAHGHSNGTAKTRTTVNVQNGGTAVFTYTAASQTCSAVSCHGNAVWSVTQFDCVSCHAAAVSGRRQITGTGGDFLRNSHHVTSGTLSKWHCIICHAEGNTSTGSTNTLHKNGSVELRNVDTPGNPGTAGTNYWSIPNTKAAADYTNIDNFCFKCHDAVGSASVAYNGTNIITTGLTATQQQKPFNDNLTNAYDQIARTRVLDVDTQFNTANYSHHAVKAAKYTATGGLPFNSVAILQGGNVDDNSRLHCHDCHILNGHGTTNEYLLQNSASTIGATDATLHGISTYVCLKCHTSTYSTTTHTAGNGSDFVNTAGAVGATARAGGKTDGNITGISCTACHNVGGTGWGGIHGGNNTYTQGGGGTQSTYRFMPGMNNNGYTVTNWTAASSAISCYTNPTTNWGVCTSHTGGKTATVTRVGGARALSY